MNLFGNALGDSIAAANGQGSRTDDLDAFLALNDNFSGVDVNGGMSMVNGRNFSQDAAARRAALNPAGLSTYSESSASPVPDAPGSGGKGITQIVAELSQPTTYTAQAKDNISRILGTSDPQAVGNFMRANGLTSSTIYAGQDYVIPGAINGLGDNSALGQSALNVDNSRLKAIADARDAQAATYYNANYGNEGRFEFLRRHELAQPPRDTDGRAARLRLDDRASHGHDRDGAREQSCGDELRRSDGTRRASGCRRAEGLGQWRAEMVMAGVDLLWQSAAYQGATEMGLDTTQSLAAARQSTAGWTDGAVLPYVNGDQQLGGVGGKLLSPMVYGKGLQLAGAAVSATNVLELEQVGLSKLALPRTPGLGTTSTTAELLQTGAIPGREGVALTQRTVPFRDVWQLSENSGVEFLLTRENGSFILRSGSPTNAPIPGGVRPIAHTHPLDADGFNSLLPSRADINVLNDYWARNPSLQRLVSQVITGPNQTTIFRATGLDPWSLK